MNTLIIISASVLVVLLTINLYYQRKMKRIEKEIKNAYRHREN